MPKFKQSAKTNSSNHTKGFAPSNEGKNGGSHALDGHHDQNSHTFNFTFSSDLASVTTLNRANGTNLKALDISTSTFKTAVGINDKGVQAVLNVEQKTSDSYFSTTHNYNDTDGDGLYVENFGIHVVNNASAKLKQQTFTFNTDGTITANASLSNEKCHHAENIATAVLTKTTLDGLTYVTKTVATPNASGYHFDVFRDDNNDGTWTQIADGQSAGSNIDTTAGTVNLVGIQSYLADASTIIG